MFHFLFVFNDFTCVSIDCVIVFSAISFAWSGLISANAVEVPMTSNAAANDNEVMIADFFIIFSLPVPLCVCDFPRGRNSYFFRQLIVHD